MGLHWIRPEAGLVWYFLNLQRSKVKHINNKRLWKDLGNCQKLPQKHFWFLGFHNSFWMLLCKDQQQHPSVHTAGGSVALTVHISDLRQVTGDIWYVTPDTWKLIKKGRKNIFFFEIFLNWCYYPHTLRDSVFP